MKYMEDVDYNLYVLKRCQCLFLNIISVLYSNNGDFGLHPQIIRIRIVKTKNSALKSDNAQYGIQSFIHSSRNGKNGKGVEKRCVVPIKKIKHYM